MSDEHDTEQTQAADARLERGPLTGSIGHDLLMAATTGVAGGAAGVVVSKVVDHFTDRPPQEPPPKIELPPGVKK